MYLVQGVFGVVEIIGRPGAGKTPICNVGTLVPPTKKVGGLSAILSAPLFSLIVLGSLIARGALDRKRLRYAGTLVRRYAELRGIEGLVDEGPTHALFTLLYGTQATPRSRWFERRAILAIARRVRIFLYLDRPVEWSLDSLLKRERPRSRFNAGMSEHEIETFNNDRTYEDIAELLAPTGKLVRVATVEEALAFLSGRPPEQEQSVIAKPVSASEPPGVERLETTPQP